MSDKEESNDGITTLTEGMEHNHLEPEATTSNATPKRKFPSDTPDSNPAKKVNTKDGPSVPVKRVPIHLESIFRKLRSIDDKLLRLELHSDFLGQYRSNDRTPRGLSVRIQPSFGRTDSAFLNQWKRVCEHCSTDLLDLTIGRLSVELEANKVLRATADASLSATASSVDGVTVRTVLEELKTRRREQLKKTKTAKFETLEEVPKNLKDKKNTKNIKGKPTPPQQRRKGGKPGSKKPLGALLQQLAELAGL